MEIKVAVRNFTPPLADVQLDRGLIKNGEHKQAAKTDEANAASQRVISGQANQKAVPANVEHVVPEIRVPSKKAGDDTASAHLASVLGNFSTNVGNPADKAKATEQKSGFSIIDSSQSFSARFSSAAAEVARALQTLRRSEAAQAQNETNMSYKQAQFSAAKNNEAAQKIVQRAATSFGVTALASGAGLATQIKGLNHSNKAHQTFGKEMNSLKAHGNELSSASAAKRVRSGSDTAETHLLQRQPDALFADSATRKLQNDVQQNMASKTQAMGQFGTQNAAALGNMAGAPTEISQAELTNQARLADTNKGVYEQTSAQKQKQSDTALEMARQIAQLAYEMVASKNQAASSVISNIRS